MNHSELSEQEILRRHKLQEIEKLGIDPYPAALYPVTHQALEIKTKFSPENAEEYSTVCVAGRIMSIRDMGKACFAAIQDASGRIQVYVKRDDICPGEDKTLYDMLFKKLTDIGDIYGIKGFVFVTKT